MLQNLREKTYKLLRWSEKYTKTDMVYLVKNGGWLMVGRGFSVLAAFLLSVAFANLLAKETFGTYKYILSIVSLLSLFTLTGMGTALTQSVAKGFEGSIGMAIKEEMRWGLIGGVLSFLLAIYYLLNANHGLAFCFGLASVFLPFINVYNVYSSILQGRRLFDLSVYYDILLQSGYVITMFLALILTRNIYAIVLVFLLSQSLYQYLVFRLVTGKITINDRPDPSVVKYGRHLSLMGVLSIATVADQVLVYHFLGPVALAVYALALAPPEQLKGILKMIGQLTLPKFAAQDKKTIKSTIFRKTALFATFIVIGAAIYIILAPFFYGIVFPKYTGSVIYSQVLAVSLVASASFLPVSAFQALGATKELYKLNFSGTAIQLLLLLAGIYYWGLMGAILARVITRFAEFAYALWLVKKI